MERFTALNDNVRFNDPGRLFVGQFIILRDLSQILPPEQSLFFLEAGRVTAKGRVMLKWMRQTA